LPIAELGLAYFFGVRMQFARLSGLAAVVLGAFAPGLHAQNIIFTNTQNAQSAPYSIPLIAGSSVSVSPNGDVKATCQLTEGRCVGMPTPGGNQEPPPGAPTVALSTTADDDTVAAGIQIKTNTQFALTTQFTNGPETCIRSATPAISGWDGVVLPGAANASVTLSQLGAHTISLRCFNAGGMGQQSLTVTGIQGGGGQDPQQPEACANFQAQHNFSRVTTTTVLSSANNANVVRDLSTLRGLYGGQINTSLWGVKLNAGQYIAMAFTGAQLMSDMSTPGASPGLQQATNSNLPAPSMAYMTVSKCPGDFRMRSVTTFNDPYMACTSSLTLGATDNMVGMDVVQGLTGHTTNPTAAGQYCKIDPNTTYYLNLVYADPRDGWTPNEFACSQASCIQKYGTN
jgi:hypothetical protein